MGKSTIITSPIQFKGQKFETVVDGKKEEFNLIVEAVDLPIAQKAVKNCKFVNKGTNYFSDGKPVRGKCESYFFKK